MVDWSALDTSMAPPGYRALRTDSVRVVLPGIRYFKLQGRDSLDWLQGQATNDVRLLEGAPWLDFCLTKPTGQILAVCRAWAAPGGTILATQRPEALVQRFEESVILEEVALSPWEDLVCLQGVETKRVAGSLPSDRTGSGGVERTPGDAKLPEVLSEEGYWLATLEAGVPIAGVDYDERTLPPELGHDFEQRHVSHSKGCYVGQEVLMRIKARGHTNKTWIGLKGSGPLQAGGTVVYAGKDVGKVHRSASSPAFGPVASATLRNEAAQEGTQVEVNGTLATVVAMPFFRQGEA
jgi:folate-binding protein YgfZ